MLTPAMSILLALLLTFAGVLALFGSWRRSLRPGRAWISAGWAAIAAAVAAWVNALGPEFGPAVAMLALPLAAWVLVGLNRRVREPGADRIRPASVRLPPFGAVLRHVGRFVLAVPLAAAASILLTLAVAWALPWADTARLAFVILAVPVAWGALSYWITADPSGWRPALATTAAAVLGGLVLYT